jgi:hypothetical protein
MYERRVIRRAFRKEPSSESAFGYSYQREL